MPPRIFLNPEALKCHFDRSTLHFVFFYENLTKISQHELKSGFFLSRSHIGRNSGFSIKIRIIPTKSGWLDSLRFSFEVL